jgi:hypothetical protein
MICDQTREVTLARNNCCQIQWKRYDVKRRQYQVQCPVGVNVDVFTHHFVTQFLKVALDCGMVMSTGFQKIFHCDLLGFEMFLHIVRNTSNNNVPYGCFVFLV